MAVSTGPRSYSTWVLCDFVSPGKASNSYVNRSEDAWRGSTDQTEFTVARPDGRLGRYVAQYYLVQMK
jgi:hypothetical protein